jgi:hypothetical protein
MGVYIIAVKLDVSYSVATVSTILQWPKFEQPHQRFTCVNPSDLSLAQAARMVRASIRLHRCALADYITVTLDAVGN